MAKQVLRKFEAYALHAHHESTNTYLDLFQKLADLSRERRIYTIGPLVIAFPIVDSEEKLFFIRAVEGGDSAPLVLNRRTGRTRENILEDAEILSEASHLMAVNDLGIRLNRPEWIVRVTTNVFQNCAAGVGAFPFL